MTEMNASDRPSSRRNPLIWIALIVIGLILFVVLNGERGTSLTPGNAPPATDASAIVEDSTTADVSSISEDSASSDTSGTIERSLLVPPGMRARQFIEQLRADGEPYPFPEIFAKADQYQLQGSLADAHLLYFFGAREGHLRAIMKMGEMSDPNLFLAQDSLLDQADAIQSYKWYRKAALMGHQPAADRVIVLHQWAQTESRLGNTTAQQLLLNF